MAVRRYKPQATSHCATRYKPGFNSGGTPSREDVTCTGAGLQEIGKKQARGNPVSTDLVSFQNDKFNEGEKQMGRRSADTLHSVPRPARGPKTYLKVLPICPGPWTTATIINQSYFGYAVYWNGTRTVASLDIPRPKPGEKEFRGLRWYAFLGVIIRGGGERLVQITETAIERYQVIEQLNGQLRGRNLGLRRMGAVRNSPMMIRLGDIPLVTELPAETDLSLCVKSLYGIETSSER
jgi:hypothetical protein